MKDDSIFGDLPDFGDIIMGGKPLVNTNGNQVRKEVGDRVTVLDYSSVTNLEGIELAPWDYDDFDDRDYYIVIAENQTSRYDSYFVTYLQDLVIVNPKNNKQYRVASTHVKLFN